MSDYTAGQNTSTGHTSPNHWLATATKSGTYEFKTGGKYVDRNIDLEIPQASESVKGTANGTGSATVPVEVGSKDSGKYPFTGSANITGSVSGTATATVNTKGFTDSSSYSGSVSGTVSGTAAVSGSMDPIELGSSASASATVPVSIGSKSGSSYPFSGSASISGTSTASVNSTGYGVKGVESATGSVSGTATVSGSVSEIGLGASGSATGSITLSDSHVGTKASGKYPIGSANNITLSGTATASVTSNGYGTTGTETGTGSVSGKASARGNLTAMAMTAPTWSKDSANKVMTLGDYKVTTSGYVKTTDATSISTGKLPAATFSNSATADVTYLDVDDAKIGSSSGSFMVPILTSGGYLYINRGYVDNIRISLAHLVPDTIDSANGFAGSSQMLLGYSLFDKDGNKVTGNIPTKTKSDLSVNGKTVTIPGGYYASQITQDVATAASPSLSVTDSTSTIVPVAISGNADYFNITTSVTGKTSYGTAGYIGAGGLAATTDTSATVGRIAAGKISNNTSGGTSAGTINLGQQIKISKGWYPNDVYYQAASASSGTAAVLGASGAATKVNTSTTATSYYVTPSASTTTSGYATAGTTKATGSAVYLAATSLSNTVNASTFTVDGTTSTSYVAPTLATTNTTGTYLDLEGYGGGTVNSVLSSNGSHAHKYMEVFTGAYSIV